MYLDLDAVGANIRKKRKLLGWSQEYLGERSGYSKQHIGNIERGQAMASIEAFVNIAEALNVSPDALLHYHKDQSEEYIIDEIVQVLKKASKNQLKVIADTLSTLIKSWDEIEDKIKS